MKFFMSNYAYPGLVRGLADLGHEVLGMHGGPDEFNWWHHLINLGKSNEEYDAILRAQISEHRPDVYLCGKGWHFGKRVNPATIEWIRDQGIATVYWSLDDPDFVGQFRKEGLFRGYRAALTCCEQSQADYRAMGFERVETMWPAWDQENWAYREVPEADMACDFLIVGTPYTFTTPPRRDVAVEIELSGLDLHVYGADSWLQAEPSHFAAGYPSLRPHYRGVWSDWRGLPGLFAHARMNFANHMHRARGYLNDRVPMVLGAGGFLFLDRQPGLEEAFLDGIDAVYYDSLADLVSKAVFYRGRPELRHAIGESGRQRIMDGHTYRHRAAQLARLAEDLCGS